MVPVAVCPDDWFENLNRAHGGISSSGLMKNAKRREADHGGATVRAIVTILDFQLAEKSKA